MANQKKSKKIVKYRRYIGVNIGTVLFGILFIYLIICIIMYLTSTHVTAYEVVEGSLSGNYHYTALTLKSEEIVTAPQSGRVTYYAREDTEVGANSIICAVEEGGAISGQEAPVKTKAALEDGIESETSSETETTSESETEMETEAEATSAAGMDNSTESKLNEVLSTFAMSYNGSSFQTTYDLKADVESAVLDMQISDSDVSVLNNSSLLNICRTNTAGIVVYSTDGLENLQADDITAELFNQKNYKKESIRSNSFVSSGDTVCKVLISPTWSIVFQLDSKVATELSNQTSVKFRFLKDNTTYTGDFQILHNGTDYFGQITLNKSLVRFAGDRFVDIELLINKKTGLKIPKSAIQEKRFYVIPEDYVIYNKDTTNEIGLIKETYATDGTSSTKHITATVYKKVSDNYYVDTSLFKEGDYVVKKDSTNKYRIADMATLQGVYNINKGYAIFREVTLIDENEEYCIVEDGNVYSLAQYDHIALDSSAVTDDEILY